MNGFVNRILLGVFAEQSGRFFREDRHAISAALLSPALAS
jgi:hypothetical protein